MPNGALAERPPFGLAMTSPAVLLNAGLPTTGEATDPYRIFITFYAAVPSPAIERVFEYLRGWSFDSPQVVRAAAGSTSSAVVPGPVFGLTKAQMDSLLAEDEAEDIELFNAVFGAAFSDRLVDAEDD